MADLTSYNFTTWSSNSSTSINPNVLNGNNSIKSTTEVPSIKPKRGHVSKACTNCRKMHAGCDHGRPCSRCVFHKMESSCVDVPRKKRVNKKKK